MTMEEKNNWTPEVKKNQINELNNTRINPVPFIGEYREKDELYNPFDHRDKKDANSDLGALAHLLKGSCSSGILAMPNAIRNGGLIVGGIGTILIGIICAHCVHILVKSSQVLCRRTKTPMMTYADTAQAAFACGPKPIRRYANFFKILVNTGLCLTYIGSVCIYVVFISESIKQVVDHYTGIDMDKRLYMIALIPIAILFAQIRNLKHLMPFSVLANICVMLSLALSLYFIFRDIGPINSGIKMVSRIDKLPIFFATVIFAIEGIGVVMPVENSMAKPQHFLGCPSVLNITMTIVVTLYALVGISGYLKYGENTASIIVLNLDTNDPLAQAVKILIALAVLLSYGLQYFTPLEIICNAVRSKFGPRHEAIGEIAIRIFAALFSVAVALAVPILEPFIALVGALFLSMIGICIPAIIETVSCWESHLGRFKWRLWKNSLLVGFSVLALLTGTSVAVNGIIGIYK